MGKDKPDMFAENKAIMPYGDNVGAPAIRPTNISAYKNEKVIKTNQYIVLKLLMLGKLGVI